MAAKTFTDIKKELPIEEGKLVADKNMILKTILKKIEQMVEKELARNKEKGIALMNTLGAYVNHKVSDKKQEKGKLFLKFDNDMEEGAKYTNVHNKIKKIRNLKRKESEFIASIDPAVLGQVVKALIPMFEQTDIQEVTDKEINAVKKLSKDIEKLKKDYFKIAKIGDKTLKDTKFNKKYESILKAQQEILSLIGDLSNQKMMQGEDIQEDAAVDAANLKARQTEEMERLKEKHLQEIEALKERHERQTKAIDLQKEKETVNKQIEAEREAARKQAQNESVELDENKGLQNKADKSGIALGILKQVYNRGLAAYKTGHRPGATAPQWAMARVNSFITKGKGTWGGADKDLAAKVQGKKEGFNEDKEEQDRDVGKKDGTQPKKYYKGLDKKTKEKRDAHFKKGKTGPAPGDEDAKTKPSTHTKKFQKMYGEKLDANADAGDYIKDFRKSDAPQFKGKSDKKIRKMAVAAYLDKKGK